VAQPGAEGHCHAGACVLCGQRWQGDGMLAKLKKHNKKQKNPKPNQVYLISKAASLGDYCTYTSLLRVLQSLFLRKFRRRVSRAALGAVPTSSSRLHLD